MSKVLKAIGTIAGVVAMFVPGLQGVGIALIGTAANIGAQLLAKPPPARGSITQSVVAVDSPTPYVMGEGYIAGVVRHIAGYGATIKKVPNPYRGEVHVYSGAGPIHSITPYVDQAAVSAWYSGFLYTSTQLGACPEAAALSPTFAGMPGWDASSKLSGKAAILWNLKFDKDGKVFASGVPQLGAYGKWVKCYDPRLDSTRSGGAGTHRVNNEATWAWSENPALHAGTYAYGRYQNSSLVMGVGLPDSGIDWAAVAAWASVCDANAWTLFGRVWEPGDRWQNLRDICAAGGGEPVFSRGVLSFRWAAPAVSLDTVTIKDVIGDHAVTAMASWRDRINQVVPKYTSPAHNWEQVAADPLSNATYLAEDGEVKRVEWPFNLVKSATQATQLAAYRMADSRELQPIELTVGPRLRAYRPGECLTLNIPELGLATDAVIVSRELDPSSMTTRLTLIGETAAKHAWALGRTGTPPATPALAHTGQQRDELRDTVGEMGATEGAPNGTVIDTILAEDVSGTISSGGGVAPNQVATAAIQTDAVSERPYAQLGSGFSLSISMQLVLDITLPAGVAGEPQMFSGSIDAYSSNYEGSMTTIAITVDRCDYSSGAVDARIIYDRSIASFSDENTTTSFAAPFGFVDTPTSSNRRYKIYARHNDSTGATAQTSSFVTSAALKR